jgi:hypothetical protein
MFGILSYRSNRPHTGVYYAEEPSIPMKETGRTFRFSYPSTKSTMREDAVTDLEYNGSTTEIETNDDLQWSPKTYIVIGADLWRISSIAKRFEESPQGALIRKPLVVFSIALDKVNNPIGLKRL